MRVGKKIFPYPMLNHIKPLSNYKDCDFEVLFDMQETPKQFVLTNLHFETNSELLNSLYDEEKIDVSCIVECSDTVYRKNFRIGRDGQELILNKSDFSEKTYITFFAYAIKDFEMKSDEFDDDYCDIEFKIDKYDIVAACDDMFLTVSHTEKENELAKSIFSVVNDHSKNDGKYSVNLEFNKITIYLSDEDYNNYKIISNANEYKEMFFNILLIPALIYALSECKSRAEKVGSIEDISDAFHWFRSVISAYKRLKNEELNLDVLKDINVIEFAQELLGKPLNESFKQMTIRKNPNTEED